MQRGPGGTRLLKRLSDNSARLNNRGRLLPRFTRDGFPKWQPRTEQANCAISTADGPTVDNRRLRRSRDKTGTPSGRPRYTHIVVQRKSQRGGQSWHRISFNHAKGTREIKARATVGSPVKDCRMGQSGNMSCRTIRNCPDWPADWPAPPTSHLECGDTSFCPANTRLLRPCGSGRRPLPRTRACLSHGLCGKTWRALHFRARGNWLS